MKVHVLRPDATAFSINRQVALVGFTALGDDVQVFDPDEFDALELADGDIVVGGIGFVHRALKRLGLDVPQLASVPEQLLEFAGRKVWRCTFIDARRAVERGEALFVKPLPSQTKLFNGQPMREFADILSTAHVPDDTVVECQELTPFVSEHRVFVINRQIVGVRHYKGEHLRFPEAEVVRSAVAAFRDAPAGYGLDVGIGEDGVTRLVEVNDGYALGSYGLAPVAYASLIRTRWAELRAGR